MSQRSNLKKGMDEIADKMLGGEATEAEIRAFILYAAALFHSLEDLQGIISARLDV